MQTTATHANAGGCEVRATADKGRGVFATRGLARGTTVDVSPVLLFARAEYAAHGRHTALAHYTFRWRDGRMALALGLGSLFNHAAAPNVTYTLDAAQECIRYTAVRDIVPGEELCIFYGDKLWFEDRSAGARVAGEEDGGQEEEDVWARLAALELEDDDDPAALVPEAELPFERVALGEEAEEEVAGVVQTVDAWVVDIPDPRSTAAMIEWLKREGLDHASLKHAKHVRKWTDPETAATRTTLLLGPAAQPRPAVPGGLAPYVLPVPRTPARTMEEVKTKGAVWPVFFEGGSGAADRAEAARWTRGTVAWFREAVGVLRREAKHARACGEMPIAAYVPAPPGAAAGAGAGAFAAHDTRRSTQHPLRHAVLNVVRAAGDAGGGARGGQNGERYLLTGRTVFTTHEPCIACSMALLHSRVKEVVFVHAMGRTGGCGGAAGVAGLRGVNHRYAVWRWRGGRGAGGVGAHVDA